MRKSSIVCVASLGLSLFALASACSSSSDSAPSGTGGGGAESGGASASGGSKPATAGGKGAPEAGSGGADVADAAGAGGATESTGEAGAGGAAETSALAIAPTLTMGSAVCGITVGGAAYCWGYGANGETGAAVGTSLVPVAVQGGLKLTTISSYGGHTCALTAAGAAYCWGDGSLGALGDGKTDGHLSKAPIAVLGGLAFGAITVGNNYTCALIADGTAYCWGTNKQGTFGLGAADDVARGVPTKLPGFKWQSISAQDDSICGVTVAGMAHCWGATSGILGTGGPAAAVTATPTAVSGTALLASVVTASADHACGLTAEGHAYCWGNGTLGDGPAGGAPAVGETQVAGAKTFKRIAGARNTFCAVTSDGETDCWGGPFPATPTASFSGIVAGEVATRGVATCVLSDKGAASCLGTNFLGELGDGTNMAHATAAPVSGGLTFELP